MYQHQLITLKNGLRLVMIPMPQVESVTVMVGVGAGSRYETKRVNGLFHFMEHMAFKGTKKRPSAFQISSEIDGIGGVFNAYTSREFTAYHIKAAAKHIELLFNLLSDMLVNSLFKEEEIEKEKGVIIEEINLREDTPQIRIGEAFIRLLYGNNPMGWAVGGEKRSVRRIKRKDFFQWIDRLYFSKNMVLAVAGGLEEGKVVELARKYFGGLKKSGKKRAKSIKLSQKKPRTKLIYKKTEQAHFCLGVPGYWYSHPERFAISVLAAILGGGMSSRLFTQIRERRGLAYYVSCSPDFFADSGYLVVQAGVRLKKINEAIKVALKEFHDLATKEVVPKELKRAKELLKGRMVLSLESSRNVAERYSAQLLLEKKIRSLEETERLIDAVTPDDIRRVAKDIFQPEKLNLAIVGPYKSESRFKSFFTVSQP